MEVRSREILFYEKESGQVPCREWLDSLEGQAIYGVLLARLGRVEQGNLGDCEPVGEGVSELRVDVGPGWRIYFGQDDDLIILLCGGMKKTQKQDIKTAKEYWEDYNA